MLSLLIFTLYIIYFHFKRDEVVYTGLDNYGSVNVTRMVSVYDGDTFTVQINKWPPIIGDNISVRIRGIDTPEMGVSNSKVKYLALVAKDKLTEMCKSGKIKLINIKRDKYFRIDAEVMVGNKNVGKTLIDLGLAKEYDGSRRPDWSDKDYNNYMNVLNRQ